MNKLQIKHENAIVDNSNMILGAVATAISLEFAKGFYEWATANLNSSLSLQLTTEELLTKYLETL